MAVLPTIPTSFVPHASLNEHRKFSVDSGGILGFLAYMILGIVFALAIGVFVYGRILDANKATKDAALANATASIDLATVQSFVQLRDRLNASKTLIANHIALSGFFSPFESLIPATVRFLSLHITVDSAGIAKVDGTGVSKSFNALSVASKAFATDGRIKDVIFSKMSINKDSSVSFGFSASIDPKLIVFSPNDTQPSITSASTTP